MTTPSTSLPSPPAVSTESWSGHLAPPEIAGRIITMIMDQAPFAASLTRFTTSSSSVVFPTVSPTGAAWIPELGRFPTMNLNEDADVIALAKLGGLVDQSNESFRDRGYNLTSQMQLILRDSLSADADRGLLFGEGSPEPQGVVAAAEPAAGPTLLAALAAAVGDVTDNGGTPDTIAMSGAAMAAVDFATDSEGNMTYPGGFGAAVRLRPVAVPGLTVPLVYDSTRMFLVINGAMSEVEWTDAFRWDFDAITWRIKTRVAVACPAPDKTLRKLAVAGEEPEPLAASATSARAKTSGKA